MREEQGDQMKKIAQNVAQTIFVEINALLKPCKEEAQNVGYLCNKKLPKVDIHPMDENWSDLVTLKASFCSKSFPENFPTF
jgi:hypothetical protein